MIGIIAAMKTELELIRSKLEQTKEERKGGIVFYRGTYCGEDVVCSVCGIGKVFAAMCAEAMILSYSPYVIINTGVAGALDDSLKILDCTVAVKCVQYDMDTSPLGDPVGMISGINKIYFDTDTELSEIFRNCIREAGKEPVACIAASGDRFIADKRKKKSIAKAFQAGVCDMESASVAQVCYVNGTPFIISRVVSDGAGDDAEYDYNLMCSIAADISSGAVLSFIEKMGGLKHA